jgi:hypothetical protein
MGHPRIVTTLTGGYGVRSWRLHGSLNEPTPTLVVQRQRRAYVP